MEQRDYVFHNTENRSEWERLQAIEAIFDPATRRRLLSTGLTAGHHCLELGPGAGSIMHWMAENPDSWAIYYATVAAIGWK